MPETERARELEVRPPADRASVVAELERLGAAVTRVAGAFETAAFFAPQREDGETKWSPAEQVRHLSRATWPIARALGLPRVVLLLRFGPSLRASRGYAEVADEYAALLETRPSAGRFAPPPERAPADEARRREIMERWSGGIAALSLKVMGWPEGALDRCRLPHPLLGKMTVREMLYFTCYHTSHHGRQMARRG